MIASFKHKGLAKFKETRSLKGIPAQCEKRIKRQLDALDATAHIMGMNVPGWDLHELKGDRKGTYAITVTGGLRLTFKFQAGNAYDVDLENYH